MMAETKVIRAGMRFHTLDGVRGVAAILVLLFHFGGQTSQMMPLGFLAVDLFFSLSGFVLGYNYEQKLLTQQTTDRQFVLARIIRLYPLYLLGLALGFAKFCVLGARLDTEPSLTGMRSVGSLLLGLALLPTFFARDEIFPFNYPSWSLFFELIINLVFLRLVQCSNYVLGACSFLAFAFLTLNAHAPFYVNQGWRTSTLLGGAARVLLSFPIGMILCRLTRGCERRKSWWSLLPPLLVVLLLCHTAPPWFMASQEMLTIVVAFPIVLILGVLLEPPEVMMVPFAFLGDVSYPIYVTHSLFTHLFVRLVRYHGVPSLVAGLLFVVCSVLTGAAAAHFFDRPARRWLSGTVMVRFSAPEQML